MTRDRAVVPRLRSQGGFSQIEMLVAIMIISLMAPVVLDLMMGGLTGTRRSSDHNTAVVWVQGEIDYLRLQCFERLQPGNRKVTLATLQPGEPPLPSGLKAGSVTLRAAGPASLQASVAVYRDDWQSTGAPVTPPVVETTTLIGDLRVAGQCP